METVSSTRFARQFGRHNQEVQSDIIQVTSHGRPIGYYLSPRAYERLMLEEEQQKVCHPCERRDPLAPAS
jgi:PHD/YefM family antitoxin component YafN of YafNO toxin-antitoxin module